MSKGALEMSFAELRNCFERVLAQGEYVLPDKALGPCSALEESILDSYRAVAAWLRFDVPVLDALFRQAMGRAALEAQSREGLHAQAHMKLVARLLAFRLQNPALFTSPLDSSSPEFLYVIGDSHALGWGNRVVDWKGRRCIGRVLPLRGIKMFHLAAGAPADYRELMQHALGAVPSGGDLLLSVGEIDCRPNEGIFHAASKQGRRLRDLIRDTVTGFADFMRMSLAQRELASVTLLGLPTPGYDVRSILNDKSRCLLFAQFVADMNAAMQVMCRENGWGFVDIHALCKSKRKDPPASYRIDDYHVSPAIYQDLSRWLSCATETIGG